MSVIVLTDEIISLIEKLYRKYLNEDYAKFKHRAEIIYSALFPVNTRLIKNSHSSKFRVKDPDHFKDKLIRKAIEAIADGKEFEINETNVYDVITDIIGIRVLHLYTNEVREIVNNIKAACDDLNYRIIEGPIANIWDEEYKGIFEALGIEVKIRAESMYTSIHYVISFNDASETKFELQVRTLMEEVWGEVSHTLNYPHATKSISCDKQIKVLARITSSGTRLVDSIFDSNDEFIKLTTAVLPPIDSVSEIS